MMKESKNWRGPWLGLALLGALALGTWGCNRELPPVEPFPIAPDAAKRAMELYDANGDGFLEGAELDKAPGLKAALKQVDANHDGKITAEEIHARIAAWKASGVGRLTVYCRVTRRGKPLPGATVTFVPESFLGGAMKPAKGTTNRFGLATLSTAEPEPLPGASPGFYRVQITKSGDAIPPRYNAETVLGQEVAQDSPMAEGTAHFDLDY